MDSDLYVYSALNKLSWPKSFSGKILFVVFIGIHIPLIGVILYLLPSKTLFEKNFPILLCVLGTTLLGTIITLWTISHLLRPLRLSSDVLENYTENKILPDLPVHYSDEIGQLMANLQSNIFHINSLLSFKNDLLSIVSHDARSPLNSIMMAQELIEDTLEQEPAKIEKLLEYNDLIKKGAFQQLEILNNILTFSRIDSGNVTIDREKVSLQNILNATKDVYKLPLKTKEITLKWNIDRKNIILLIDKIKFKAILNNLIQNAIKFTESGGSITISTHHQNQTFKLLVQDTGQGISPKVKPYLFKPNEKSNVKGTAEENGTGLGLWICKTFTELHNGQITYESVQGEGTTFILSFDVEEILVTEQKISSVN